MKHWLVIYDIRDHRRLNRIAKKLKSFGQRVQKSVFEIEATDSVIKKLRSQIKRLMDEDDFVVYFDVCEKDWQKRLKHGPSKFEDYDEKEYYII